MTTYNIGEAFGPYNLILKEKIKISTRLRGKFECPECHEDFICEINKIVKGQKYKCSTCERKDRNKDIIGQTFGRLTVLNIASCELNKRVKYLCQCSCGNQIIVDRQNLLKGNTKSCGCLHKEIIMKDLTGQRFGKLVVLGPTDKRDTVGKIIWHCKCDCGNETFVYRDNLKTGHTQSCGHCLCSHGETKVKEILNNLNIQYIQQKTFENCVSKKQRKLRFDFYLPDYNTCIEYDGQQHFSKDYCFSTISEEKKEEIHKDVKERDNIKNEYCQANNIKLIRIPYTDYDLLDEEYLKQRLL